MLRITSTSIYSYAVLSHHLTYCPVLTTAPPHRTTHLYTSLHYTTLYYTILHYTILYYTVLYYTILYYTILYYTILCYATLHLTTLYYTILYYTTLYYTTPHYITLPSLHFTLPHHTLPHRQRRMRCTNKLFGERLQLLEALASDELGDAKLKWDMGSAFQVNDGTWDQM